ncbi:MAG TPA: D-sedoheptulose 7-phosphate isomerase [Pseudorhodoplanes sp.]|nr:D-sedoheptulose 7-phosphate isomerase [Pseudorhodoplanes sp.]
MADPRAAAIESFFRESQKTMEAAATDRELQATVLAISDRIAKCFRDGGKLLLAGNGGSAADAQHIAAEFVVRYTFDRAPLPAIALTTDTSALTAAGNDYGYEHVFERQVRALGRAGDVFIGYTTSGKSANVLAALKAAREMGVITVGFTGTKGAGMKSLCDLVLIAPSAVTAQIQQIHITAGHAICGIVERDLFKAPEK